MGFQEAVRKCIRDWNKFRGRASRSEYWWFVLAVLLFILIGEGILIGLGFAMGRSGIGSIILIVFSILFLIVAIFLMIANISVVVRRLHDKDKSGWFFWLQLIPLVGPIILLVWFCTRGTTGPNTYGDDPLGGEGTAQIFE